MNPSQDKRILFLYSAPTGGHKSCADAARKALQSLSPPIETFGIDAVTYLYPFLGPIIAKTYLEIVRRTPEVWDFLYDNPRIEGLTREIRQFFSFFNAPKLKFLLSEFNPSLVACTHALPCGLIAEQKRRGRSHIPLAAVITDYNVHSYWVYPEVDLYIVANSETEETLVSRGVHPQKIRVCGIPIDPDFAPGPSKEAARRKLGLEESKPTILLMGGSHGLGPMAEMVRSIVSIRPEPQIIAVTGNNKDLEKDLVSYRKLKNVRVYGYAKQIPLLMSASDILITKPGGMTTSEALAKKLPMILINPIPGQEERNARYLLKNGAAIEARNLIKMKEILRGFLNHPKKLEKISAQAAKISRPASAMEAAREIQRIVLRNSAGARPEPARA